MDLYILTSEFWTNMMWAIGATAVFLFSAWWFNRQLDDFEWTFGRIIFILGNIVVVAYSVPHVMVHSMTFSKLWEVKRGPLKCLTQDVPLLYNNYERLEEKIEEIRQQEMRLQRDENKSTTGEAREIYSSQISALKAQERELVDVTGRIEIAAQKLYFSKYITKLQDISADKSIEKELKEVKDACSTLVK